jgi:hypothetical protein
MRYLITIQINSNQSLIFRVDNYTLADGRCVFTDSKTGLIKNYPAEKCLIEEMM